MNDYLWDRTGNDPEIEELERRLGAFRAAHSEPPLIMPAPSAGRRGFLGLSFAFRFAFAGASALVLLAAAVFVLQFTSSVPSDISISFAEPDGKVAPVEFQASPSGSTPREFSSKNRQVAVTTTRAHARKFAPPRAASRTSSPPSEDHLATLTEEERNAYDQLMLALSITSSRLKMVQDIADGNSNELSARVDEESSRSN